MILYGLVVSWRGFGAVARKRMGEKSEGSDTGEAGTDSEHAFSPNQAHLTKHTLPSPNDHQQEQKKSCIFFFHCFLPFFPLV